MDRAVLFDLDDTLLVDEPDVDLHFRHVTADIEAAARVAAGSVAAAVRAAARERWRAGPLFAVARRLGFSSWEGLAADFVGGHPLVDPFREWVPTFRQEVWRSALAQYDAADRSTEVADRYRQQRRSSYRLFPETLGVLAQLRGAGWLLAIVTNGPPDLQREKIAAVRLDEHVDVVAVSGEVGAVRTVWRPGPGRTAGWQPALGSLTELSAILTP